MSEILIVDDNPANLDLLGSLLRERAYKVRISLSGRQALEASRRRPPDLILLDITMPELDGYETCQAFKADPALASVPVIFVSALDDPLDKVKAFTTGGADYITKPFQAEEVLARVNHHLQIASLQRDLLERNRRLEEAYARLHELNEQKNVFFGIVTHDLRNPLNAIVLSTELLREEESLEEVRHRARQIEKEALEMSALIGRFLDIAAIESGKVKAEPTVFQLGKIASHVANQHLHWAQGKGIEIQVEQPAGSGMASADMKFTKEILDNLISNAIKFSPPGKTVTVKVEDRGDTVLLSVEDQGPGLTPEDNKKLFGRFARLSAQPTAGEKSIGLGLSIVKHMVDAMGGRIWADSEPGHGAAFRVELPAGHTGAARPSTSESGA